MRVWIEKELDVTSGFRQMVKDNIEVVDYSEESEIEPEDQDIIFGHDPDGERKGRKKKNYRVLDKDISIIQDNVSKSLYTYYDYYYVTHMLNNVI